MIGVGPSELLVILAIIMLLFGASKVPELARSLGKAKGEFKKGIDEGEEEEAKEETEKEEKPPEE
ncbi:MAG: twin-arginine translocase TatA/TatE family subunit [Candidatus Hydrothermarchaeaceae archaeon]